VYKNRNTQDSASDSSWAQVYPDQFEITDTAKYYVLNTRPGFHVILGLLKYRDNTYDSTRIIVDLREGRPRIDSVRPSPNIGPDSLSPDSVVHFIRLNGESAYSVIVYASDPDGTITTFYRQAYHSATLDSTDVSAFHLAGAADTISCPALSACPDTLTVTARDSKGSVTYPVSLIFLH
jgi:hypothetical protein